MSLSYASEKYTRAMRLLVVSHGSLQERLSDAFRSHLSSIMASRDLPPGLRAEHEELHAQVTRCPGGDEGSIAATFRRMSDREASEVAEQVVDLYHKIRGLYDAPLRVNPDGSRVLGDLQAMVLSTDPGDDGRRPSRN
jgi:hypothetical protein